MKHTLGLIRHLRRAGHEVIGFGGGWRNRSRWSRYPTDIVPADERDEQQWLQDLTDRLQRFPADVYIPVGFPVNEFASLHREAISRLCGLAVPSPEAFALARDKLRMAQTAEQLGVGTPHTFGIRNRAEAVALQKSLHFPLVIKGRFETGGQRLLAVISEASGFMPAFDRLCAEFCLTEDQLPIVQEFIPGTGYGFFAFYQHGTCRRVFMHRRVRELPASGGCSTCAESICDEALEAAGRKLLDHLDWHGVAMAEFRRDDRDGSYKLMEINPKFWGSLELALAAGADFASDYVKVARGEDLPVLTSADYRCGLRYAWPFDGDIQHAMERPASLPSVVRDMMNPFVMKNSWLRDPLPLLHSMLMCGRQVLRKICRKSEG
jgi:predicted ATP-grasp superfamily ATP-dependent carboligase